MNRQTVSESSKRQRCLSVVLLLAVSALVMTACVTVEVANISETRARVRITLPDTPSGYTRLVRAGQSTSTFSEYGGTVTVTVLPDEQYRQLLQDLRTEITRRLFEDRQTLSASDVSTLVNRLNDVEESMAQLEREGASCSVRTSDFATVTAILSWDDSISNWSLSCAVRDEDS